jgi:quinol-cytochrome oxidoreductase complex cytochrome b subunit
MKVEPLRDRGVQIAIGVFVMMIIVALGLFSTSAPGGIHLYLWLIMGAVVISIIASIYYLGWVERNELILESEPVNREDN